MDADIKIDALSGATICFSLRIMLKRRLIDIYAHVHFQLIHKNSVY